jgi:hypothetical protein
MTESRLRTPTRKNDVHGAPKPRCRRASDLHPSKIRNRAPAADRGQAALVAIAERRRRFASAQPGSQNRGYVGATLLRRGRKPGHRLVIPSERKRGIADRKDIRESRNRERSGPTLMRPARSASAPSHAEGIDAGRALGADSARELDARERSPRTRHCSPISRRWSSDTGMRVSAVPR